MAKLSDMDIERVDGVDQPATGRKFLLMKSEEDDELHQNMRDLIDKIEHALRMMAKSEDLFLSEELASSLNEVAKALDLDITFKARRRKEDYGEPPGDEEEYGYPPPKRPAKKDSIYEVDVTKALSELEEKLAPVIELAKALAEKKAEQETQQSQRGQQSRQVISQDNIAKSAKRLGEGLFTDIVFG